MFPWWGNANVLQHYKRTLASFWLQLCAPQWSSAGSRGGCRWCGFVSETTATARRRRSSSTAPPPRTITTRPSSFTLSPPTAANPTPSAATTRTCSRRWGAVISHFCPFLCCSCFLHTSSLQLSTVCLVTSCILLCGIWNSAACSVNICVPATPTDQWSGLEMTQSLSPLITDLLFFLSQCIYQWLSFFLTTDVFLSLVVLRPELHPEFQRKAGAGAALPEPAGGPTPHCGGCGLRLRLHDAPHRSCWTFTKGLTPPSPPRGLNTPLNQGDTWLYNHYPTWV